MNVSSRPACKLTVAVLTGLLVIASSAAAESAVLLPHKGDEGIEAKRSEAHGVLARALEDQGIEVVSGSVAAEELEGGPGHDCETVDCAPLLVKGAGADFAAAIAVWSDGQPPRPTTVFVTIVDSAGARFPGKAAIEADDIAAATTAALLEARALQLVGPGPWLRVRGTPDGAQVLLDDNPVGSIPYRSTIGSGRHNLEVRHRGHRPHVQTIDVPLNMARQLEVDVSLQPHEGGSFAVKADAFEHETEASYLNYVIAGGLGVIGVLSLAKPVRTWIGDCAVETDAGCTARYQSNGTVALHTAVAGLSIGGGVVMALWTPIRTEVAATPSSTSVRVTGDF